MSNPLRVIVLSRKDCHLCDVVYRMAVRLQLELHIDTKKVSIEGDTDLMERHGARVPVVLLDGIEHFSGNVTEGELTKTSSSPFRTCHIMLKPPSGILRNI